MCQGTIGEWTSWSNCDRSCNEGVRIRTRKCFDADGNELDAGFCEEDERELDMCNLGRCDDSIWEGKDSHWTSFGDLTDCDANEVKTRDPRTYKFVPDHPSWSLTVHPLSLFSQDIVFVTLAVENVKVMSAWIVAKINQESSNISLPKFDCCLEVIENVSK